MNLFTVLRILFFAPPPPGTLRKCGRFDARELGKCTDLLEDLASYTGRYNEERFFENSELEHNISLQCDKALACYAPIQCQEIHAQMQELRDACIYYKLLDFKPCLGEFYKKSILGSDEFPCLKKHDFMAKNLTKQNEAYTQGKECFLTFVNQRCKENVQKWFTGNYEYFVEKMTIEPENNTCDSLHERLILTRCHYVFEEESKLIRGFHKSLRNLQKDDAVKLCRYRLTCNNEKCFASGQYRGLLNRCDLIEILYS